MKILLIEDDPIQLNILADYLSEAGYVVDKAPDGEAGMRLFNETVYDLVISDFRMPNLNGREVLEEVRRINPFVAVIIVTAYSSIEDAVALMKLGAVDYIQKPFPINELLAKVKALLLLQESVKERNQLREIMNTLEIPQRYVFTSSNMTEILSVVRRVCRSDASVLICGESGTGKEVIADIIHYLSPRARNKIVKINCSAIPETLMESELFGHTKGAFTGAVSDRIGRFEEANHGTIFLDEIGDLTPLIQVKLLRVLQDHTFEPVGSNRTRTADVRVIAATNKNLAEMVHNNSFREDLFYRLNVVPITLPPLRERKEDIPLLVTSFLKELSPERPCVFQKEALMKMVNYAWPGNIRQLRNVIQRLVTLSRSGDITLDDLPDEVRCYLPHHESNSSLHTLAEMEKKHIVAVLQHCKGNQTEAAAILGIHRNTLANKIRDYQIDS